MVVSHRRRSRSRDHAAIALAAIDNGADVIELGVPFSDPLADGPVIQRASERAVARGSASPMCWKSRASCAPRAPPCGMVIFSYLNPVVRMGMKQFCAAAAAAGVDGVLLTDMIVEEADEYLAEMRANGLAPIFLAAPTSPDARLKAIAEASQGFVYAISRVGITGAQQKVAGDASALVDRLRVFTQPLRIPIAVGFGISNAEHVRAVGRVRRRRRDRQRPGGADREHQAVAGPGGDRPVHRGAARMRAAAIRPRAAGFARRRARHL